MLVLDLILELLLLREVLKRLLLSDCSMLLQERRGRVNWYEWVVIALFRRQIRVQRRITRRLSDIVALVDHREKLSELRSLLDHLRMPLSRVVGLLLRPLVDVQWINISFLHFPSIQRYVHLAFKYLIENCLLFFDLRDGFF